MTSLVKKIESASGPFNKAGGVSSFVVFLNDDEDMEDKLKDFAKKQGIEKTVLSIDNVAGPKGYSIAKDAHVTVLIYNKRKVEVNHAFRKGQLDAKAIEAVVKDISKIDPR